MKRIDSSRSLVIFTILAAVAVIVPHRVFEECNIVGLFVPSSFGKSHNNNNNNNNNHNNNNNNNNNNSVCLCFTGVSAEGKDEYILDCSRQGLRQVNLFPFLFGFLTSL